jgi:hypothetical protein
MKEVLQKLPQLRKLFTTKIDGVEARAKQMRGRPHADLFVKASRKMHLGTERCVVFSTNMDRGYRKEDLDKFHVFFDVVQNTSVNSNSLLPISSGSGLVEPSTPQSSSGLNLISILDSSGFPASTAKCEDLILQRQRRKTGESPFA